MKIVKQSVELKALLVSGSFSEENGFQSDGNCIPEKIIENAGRVCYKSEGSITEDSYRNFVDKICNQYHHESVMEHSCATFHIVTDRGISHEIVRHRLMSFSQESTRYCAYNKDKFGNEISVIQPPNMTGEQQAVWKFACSQAEGFYFEMLNSGCTPQIARSVLPTCLKTELVVTCNFRNWKHFIELRTDKAAHPQIREIAMEIQKILKKVAPVIFGSTNE